MRIRFLPAACLLFGVTLSPLWEPVLRADPLTFPVLGEIHRTDPAFAEIIGQDAHVQVLASGFDWTEGPCWVPGQNGAAGYLLFCDIPQNKIYKWAEGQGLSLFMQPSGYTGVTDYGAEPGSNGLVLDPQGRLVCCEHGDRRLSVLTQQGGKRTLVDNYQGKRLNSPNDAVYKSNGDLYFTDPPYGLPKHFNDERRELDFCGVYRLAKDGTLTLLTGDLTRPNGLAFSPDEQTLYVAQSDPAAPIVMAFPVREDGTLGQGRVFYDFTEQYQAKLPGLPDGMAVDVKGRVFATAPGGIYVLSPEGKLLGRISTGERTSNCTFGGADGSILYLTADSYVCRIQTKTRGHGR